MLPCTKAMKLQHGLLFIPKYVDYTPISVQTIVSGLSHLEEVWTSPEEAERMLERFRTRTPLLDGLAAALERGRQG